MKWTRTVVVGLVASIATFGIVWAGTGSPTPSVGLYWLLIGDPTTAPGVVAPLNQLGIRTDTPSLYYKSGNAATAWTEIGAPGGGGGGGTVTSIACGAGVTCTPSPITSTGTITIASRFNIPGETINTETATELDNYDPWHAGPHTARVEVDPTQAALTITGIVAGSDGDELLLWNGGNGGSAEPNWITLPNQSASSSGANRFWIADGKLVNIVSNDGLLLIYDGGFGWTAFGAATSILRAQELSLDPAAIPTALTSGSTTNNYNPWSAMDSTTSYVRQDVSGSGTATITGIIAAGAPNSDGRILVWNNISTTGSLTFKSQDGASSGPNQIVGPNNQDVTVSPLGSVTFIYDDAFDAWRVLNATIANAITGTGTSGDLTAWTSSSTIGNFAGATCGGGTFATAIAANGGLTCSTPSGTISGLTTGDLTVAASATSISNFPGTTCGGAGFATAIAATGALTCSTAGTVSGGTATDIAVFGTGGTSVVNFGGKACSGGQFATAIGADGTLTCSAVSGTISGLTTGDLTVAASATSISNYAGATCGGGTFATAIAANGGLTCSTPSGTISGLTAGDLPIATSGTAIGNSHESEALGEFIMGNSSTFCSISNGACTLASFTASNLSTFNAALTMSNTRIESVAAPTVLTDGSRLQEDVAPPTTAITITSATNPNYSPTGVGLTVAYNITAITTNPSTMSGFVNPASNKIGSIIEFVNTSTSTLEFTNQDAASSSGNRFLTTGGVTVSLGANQAIYFWYTGTSTGSWLELWQTPTVGGSTPNLAIANAAVAAGVNLSTVGTGQIDWEASATSTSTRVYDSFTGTVNGKLTGGGMLLSPGVDALGTSGSVTTATSAFTFSSTAADTSTLVALSSTSGTELNTAVANATGMRFVAPATNVQRVFRIYTSHKSATMVCTAHLQDGSAPDVNFSSTAATGTTASEVQTVTFTAASPSTYVVVTCVITATTSGPNMAWYASVLSAT